MGTKMKVESNYINFELNEKEITGYKLVLETKNAKYAKSNDTYRTLAITEDVQRIVTNNELIYKMIKDWTKIRYGMSADFYVKVTVTQVFVDEVFREIVFPNAYMRDFTETINPNTGEGSFVITLLQKIDKVEDIVFQPFDEEFKENNNFDDYLNESQAALKKGIKGENVKQLQIKLNNLGYNCDIDGVFGNKTEIAVKNFQKDHNLVVDGIAGKNTYDKLLQAQNKIHIRKTINENRVILTKLLEKNNVFYNREGAKVMAIINNNKIVIENGNVTVSYGKKEKTYIGTIIMGRTVVDMNKILSDFDFGKSFETCHKPYDKFSNADEAALAFALTYGPVSINNDREYNAIIYQYRFGYFSDSYWYGFTSPTIGDTHSVKVQINVIPKAGEKAEKYVNYGTIHTHGAESGPNAKDERFSPNDISIVNNKNNNFECGYLITPGGKLLKYIQNGKESILTDKLTKDPNAKVFD